MQLIAQNTNSIVPGQCMRIAANQDMRLAASVPYTSLICSSFDEHNTVDEYNPFYRLQILGVKKNPHSGFTTDCYRNRLGIFFKAIDSIGDST